jgi:hypothetical protein
MYKISIPTNALKQMTFINNENAFCCNAIWSTDYQNMDNLTNRGKKKRTTIKIKSLDMGIGCPFNCSTKLM